MAIQKNGSNLLEALGGENLLEALGGDTEYADNLLGNRKSHGRWISSFEHGIINHDHDGHGFKKKLRVWRNKILTMATKIENKGSPNRTRNYACRTRYHKDWNQNLHPL